jgi:hypothetical protein
MIAYRFALEFPSFVTHLLTFAVPYLAVSDTFIPMDAFVEMIATKSNSAATKASLSRTLETKLGSATSSTPCSLAAPLTVSSL